MRKLAIATLALLLMACGGVSPTEPNAMVAPQCQNPAPLINAENRANPDALIDEYIVLLRPDSDVHQESARLASRYEFVVKETFWIVPAFGADLDAGVVAKLRCEPVVKTIEVSRTNIPPP